MQIFLNSEQLDVTLENEETLGEVYHSLNSWINEAGLHPLSLSADGRALEISDPGQWEKTPIQDTENLEITAGTINAVRAQQIMTALDYINLLLQMFPRMLDGEELNAEFQAAFSEYRHVRTALPQIMQISDGGFSEDFSLLDAAAEKTAASLGKDSQPASPVIRDFSQRLEQLRILLLDRLQEYSNPGQELISISGLIAGMLPSLEEAGIALQTGREKEAYNLVFKISEMCAKLVRVIDCLSMEDPRQTVAAVKEGISKLGQTIEEINNSIAAGDMVLLSDLLEYDLRESMEALMQSISEARLGAE